MTLELKPVSSFYCCYLLRSKARHDKLYVGSTPNPKRRLDQHNGVVKGGANRTGFRGGIWRPWEMSLIVTGFPSNIAALQFEWAWQNSHLTRKISKEQRISIAQSITKWSRKRGKTVNKPARLPVSLKDKLANLHLLLRVPSFARWPLQLRFFREDVYNSWRTWIEEVEAPLREEITIIRDYEDGSEATDTSSFPQARINALDVSYLPLKDQLEKSLLLKNTSNLKCACCSASIDMADQQILVCTKATCYSVSHLGCLSAYFLAESEEFLPIEGHCPKCQTRLRWADLVQELTLRTRDAKHVTKLLKPKRKKAGIVTTQAAGPVVENGEQLDDEEELDAQDVLDEPSMHGAEMWENSSLASVDSGMDTGANNNMAQSNSERKYDLTLVIEDSEDSDDWKMIDES